MKPFIIFNFFLGIIIIISLCNCLTQDPLKFFLAAGIGTLLLVSLVILRIYLASVLPFRSFFNLNFSWVVKITVFCCIDTGMELCW